MSLAHIEVALRPQFVWEGGWRSWKNPRPFYFTGGQRHRVEGTKKLGICVFVGLSALYGFKKEEVCTWLQITSARYDKLLGRYNDHMKNAIADQAAGKYNKHLQFSGLVLTKSQLVQSYLVHQNKVMPVNFRKAFIA